MLSVLYAWMKFRGYMLHALQQTVERARRMPW